MIDLRIWTVNVPVPGKPLLSESVQVCELSEYKKLSARHATASDEVETLKKEVAGEMKLRKMEMNKSLAYREERDEAKAAYQKVWLREGEFIAQLAAAREENERLMRMDYWQSRAITAEADVKRMRNAAQLLHKGFVIGHQIHARIEMEAIFGAETFR